MTIRLYFLLLGACVALFRCRRFRPGPHVAPREQVRRRCFATTILAFMWICAISSAHPQDFDDLNLQVHGYATQAFIYSTNNNWNTTDSTDGSAAWTEAVVNLTAQPQPKLRIGVQARYFLLGDYGNKITLDWAQGDYKFNEHAGVRAGKVKTPNGLLNEIQDIDPAYLWVMLPQGVYDIASRDSVLAHYGGVFYGSVPLGESFGKVEYRAFGGERVLGPDDAYFQTYRDSGFTLADGLSGPIYGGSMRWNAPVRGLVVGASVSNQKESGTISAFSLPGKATTTDTLIPSFFGKYESSKWMLAGEYTRTSTNAVLQLTGIPRIVIPVDDRSFYAMASYKLSSKLTGGVYYSSAINKQAAFTSSRYQKDWNMAARYDFNSFLYLKAEQHFIEGTLRNFSTSNNPNGYQPNTRITLAKLGVSF